MYEAILEELHALHELRPGWLLGAVYEDAEDALDPLDRREQDRLRHLGRGERQVWRERTRERVARERSRPWNTEEPWFIHKQLWRERRDRERELLDVRESAILERENDLRHWLPLYRRRLAELAILEPDTAPWCASMARDEIDPPSIADLNAVWERYRTACARCAEALRVRPEIRQKVESLRGMEGDAARRVESLMVEATIPVVAGVFAALIG